MKRVTRKWWLQGTDLRLDIEVKVISSAFCCLQGSFILIQCPLRQHASFEFIIKGPQVRWRIQGKYTWRFTPHPTIPNTPPSIRHALRPRTAFHTRLGRACCCEPCSKGCFSCLYLFVHLTSIHRYQNQNLLSGMDHSSRVVIGNVGSKYSLFSQSEHRTD